MTVFCKNYVKYMPRTNVYSNNSPYFIQGCAVKVTPLDLDSHIASCEFNQPEASSQPQVQVPCTFSALGCKETFETQEEMNGHLHNDVQTHMSVSYIYDRYVTRNV